MALLVPPDARQTFYSPQFAISLKGQTLDPLVLRDVQEVSYSDGGDGDMIDSFEFTLGDWDPVRNEPRYSSPWTKDGSPSTIDGKAVPNFEPGADVELRLGYQGDKELTLMMRGEVVSIAPSFPAAGAPVVRVRALNYLHQLQRARFTGTLEGKPLQIAAQIAEQVGVAAVDMPADGGGGESRRDVLSNVSALEEIRRRATAVNLTLRLEDDGRQTTLYFDPPVGGDPVTSLAWGLNLISFSPQLTARGAMEAVVVRNGDPAGQGAAKQIVGRASWSQLTIDGAALGPTGVAGVQTAISGTVEEITDAEVRSQADADKKALDRLTAIARDLVRGSGSTIGNPRLRAGAVVELARLGARFSGLYQLTQTTHTIGGAGYTTSFQARKLVLT